MIIYIGQWCFSECATCAQKPFHDSDGTAIWSKRTAHLRTSRKYVDGRYKCTLAASLVFYRNGKFQHIADVGDSSTHCWYWEAHIRVAIWLLLIVLHVNVSFNISTKMHIGRYRWPHSGSPVCAHCVTVKYELRWSRAWRWWMGGEVESLSIPICG